MDVPEAIVSLTRARLLRLRDFASLYGAVFGNMQMRTTGLWFVWDLAQMHEDVQNRVKEQGKALTYAVRHNNVDERGMSGGSAYRALRC